MLKHQVQPFSKRWGLPTAKLALMALAGSAVGACGAPPQAQEALAQEADGLDEALTCSPGSISAKTGLYFASVDANRLITYGAQAGTISKKASLDSACVGSTKYTISGTRNLPYPNGTALYVSGKVDFTLATPTAIYVTVNNGSIDGSFTSRGADTGLSSSAVSLYNGAVLALRTKSPWQ